jgi:hypothetical protein
MYVQLLLRWAMNVYGVGSAHNRAMYLIMVLIVLNLSSFRTHEPHQCITDNIKKLQLLTTLKTLQLDMVSNHASPLHARNGFFDSKLLSE